jgi:eukaryotic-like serine/threonine-protein kinase
MPGDTRVRLLLEEILESGSSPEAVCRACPELLPQVRRRWRRVQALQAEVGALFPGPGSTAADVRDARPVRPAVELPDVPGYEVQAVLGRGGMGVVFKAWHLRLNRPVALKLLLDSAYATPAERARLLQEAELVAGLRHPNIVQVHDVGEQDGRPYFTMEFIEGGSLAEALAGTPQPARQAAGLLATLAEAVHVAHQAGIVHRDLKPGNVLLTADGTPKVSDFGLARHLDGGAGLTRTGTALGTPGYMAPEQALGQSRAVGPATDVYALGAILYELLTGRPPFRAQTAAETVQQAISQEPVPPSRLNAAVPRDAETICLKCLHKDPAKRYTSAAALADDLKRFLAGRPIAARRVGKTERLLRWVRRNPTGSALAVTALALLGLSFGAGLREWSRAAERRTETAKAVARIENVVRLQQEGRLLEARAVLDRVTDPGSHDLRERIERAEADLKLADRLEAIRLNRAAIVGGRLDLRANEARADRDYDRAFRAAGLGGADDDPTAVATRATSSNIRRVLLSALDDWALCADAPRRREWVLGVARKIDPAPPGWGSRVRDPAVWNDRAALTELARTAPVEEPTVQLLVALAERLRAAGGDAVSFLKRAHRSNHGDFWTNVALGDALVEKNNPGEAIRYYQAALAVRPGAAAVYNNLGIAIALSGRTDEAIDDFRSAVRIDPGFAHAHSNLGNCLRLERKYAEAMGHYRQAVAIDPDSITYQCNLGVALAESGQPNEAIDHYRLALRTGSKFAKVHSNLGNALWATGQLDQAIDHLRQAVNIRPEVPDYHNNLGNSLYAKGYPIEAVEQFRRAIELDPKYASAHSNLGIALAETELADEGIEHLQQAIRLDPKNPVALSNLGTAFAALSRLDEAIDSLQQALRIDPNLPEAHETLGRVLLASGRVGEAHATMRRFLDLLPPQHPRRPNAQQELQHCERLLTLEHRLPAVLLGKDRPVNADESLQFAVLGHGSKRYAVAARLSEEAFAAMPRLANDILAGHRYYAACAAARAGGGVGEGGKDLGVAERARWREQARRWLWADLVEWGRQLAAGSAADSALVRRTMAHWLFDPDLAGLRDASVIDVLAPDERRDCHMLWREVDELLHRARAAQKR